MSLQFSRSMRVLRLDSFKAARIGLVLAALNMTILVLWFFFARVTLYEVSTDLQLDENDQVTAAFSKDAISRIRSGQTAWLRIDPGSGGQATRVQSLVYEADPNSDRAVFVILTPGVVEGFGAGPLKGAIEVEVEHVSPAELVMRSSNQMMNRQSPGGSTQNENGT